MGTHSCCYRGKGRPFCDSHLGGGRLLRSRRSPHLLQLAGRNEHVAQNGMSGQDQLVAEVPKAQGQ